MTVFTSSQTAKPYAAVAASSPVKDSSQNSVQITLLDHHEWLTRADTDTNANAANQYGRERATAQKTRGYPPIVVENLPNRVVHFEEFGQKILRRHAAGDHQVTWYFYALETENLIRWASVVYRSTAPDIIVLALELHFPAERKTHTFPEGRPGCLFYAMSPMSSIRTFIDQLPTPSEMRTLREGHVDGLHQTSLEGPTCANCQGPHLASDRRCPVFRRWHANEGNRTFLPLSQIPLSNIDSSIKAG
ncbi:hypothetical protein EVAR_26750_1 [Eumeta japonica]|uniref:Uncharacterized protein n=1 Tax=Eumeta variegata TaxID=151549 RepID=A0A4C2A7T5_EUMVA|nr:hypothetical protein EVAR_26750_1 [Eumeta japonica]